MTQTTIPKDCDSPRKHPHSCSCKSEGAKATLAGTIQDGLHIISEHKFLLMRIRDELNREIEKMVLLEVHGGEALRNE